jgi:hypothetical protein
MDPQQQLALWVTGDAEGVSFIVAAGCATEQGQRAACWPGCMMQHTQSGWSVCKLSGSGEWQHVGALC